jgi:hypothetical protein
MLKLMYNADNMKSLYQKMVNNQTYARLRAHTVSKH